jgi:hypothetical protein
MKFSQRMRHAKLSENELQLFETNSLGKRFKNVYFDIAWTNVSLSWCRTRCAIWFLQSP